MSTELTKNLMCICLFGDIEIWLEQERAAKIQAMLESSSSPRFVNIDGQSINTSNIVGIFTAQAMEARTRRKNGQWQCENLQWPQNGPEGRNEHYWCNVDAKKSKPPMYAKPYKDDDGNELSF